MWNINRKNSILCSVSLVLNRGFPWKKIICRSHNEFIQYHQLFALKTSGERLFISCHLIGPFSRWFTVGHSLKSVCAHITQQLLILWLITEARPTVAEEGGGTEQNGNVLRDFKTPHTTDPPEEAVVPWLQELLCLERLLHRRDRYELINLWSWVLSSWKTKADKQL